MFEEFLSIMGEKVRLKGMYLFSISIYIGSPTYAVFTTEVPTTTIFGLCTRKWGIFGLVGDPPTVLLTWILFNKVFFKSQNPCKVGPPLTQKSLSNVDYVVPHLCGFWLMYTQVEDFCINWLFRTVPLTSKNPCNAGTLCSLH